MVKLCAAYWNKCPKCKVHFHQRNPGTSADLCPDCWKSLPHYRLKMLYPKPGHAKDEGYSMEFILLYLLGCSLCLLIIAYYLFYK